ncbi:MAG: hypothetical protein WDZ40_03055 [Candidatus Spechtbacterales bacterium]
MEHSKEVSILWLPEQESVIEEACQYALMGIDTYGAMHPHSVLKVLEKGGYTATITNTKGQTAPIVGLAMWRLARDKRIKYVQGRTYVLRDTDLLEDASIAEKQLVKIFINFGSIATPENLNRAGCIEGLGERTISDVLEDFKKVSRIKTSFFFSPNRRLWTVRN